MWVSIIKRMTSFIKKKKVKVKLPQYTPWKHMGAWRYRSSLF